MQKYEITIVKTEKATGAYKSSSLFDQYDFL